MAEQQKNNISLITKDSFQAIGIKWEGTFADASAGGIRAVQQIMKDRLHEINDILHPETLLGLSYHAFPGGETFVHYAVVEVKSALDIPNGMEIISVPGLTYAACKHHKGWSIKESYNNIYRWIQLHQYQQDNSGGLTHFEKYPMAQDPYDRDPEFEIMIPVCR